MPSFCGNISSSCFYRNFTSEILCIARSSFSVIRFHERIYAVIKQIEKHDGNSGRLMKQIIKISLTFRFLHQFGFCLDLLYFIIYFYIQINSNQKSLQNQTLVKKITLANFSFYTMFPHPLFLYMKMQSKLNYFCF